MVAVTIPRVDLGPELGRGAYSVVLRGSRDGHEFAVKLPRRAATDAERELGYRRFLREAVTLARVRHPALPAVMEVGRSDGMPYLIMELAAGQTLLERLKRGRLDEADVLVLGVQIAGALDAIHAAGLVHRDVTPRNIVFDAVTGAARLVDLGSASLVQWTKSDHEPSSVEVSTVDLAFADSRIDLIGLGLVLLDCLGARDVDANVTPETFEAALVERGVSAAFGRVLGRLVVPASRERYSAAARLLSDLIGLAADKGVSSSVRRGDPRPSDRRLPLIGRGPDLDRLRRVWADVRRSGKIVFLRGPPGIGKSRLARTFTDDLASAAVPVLSAACHPRDPRAFSAVRQLVDGYLRDVEKLPATERARALADVRTIAGDLGSLLGLLSPALARLFHDAPAVTTSENAEQAFAESVAEFVDRLLRTLGGVVVFVDDVQWLDASSRRVLSRAANHVRGLRTLFLFGARSTEPADLARFTDTITSPVTTFDVGGLSDDDVLQITRSYLGAQTLDRSVEHAILRLSDGTPLRALEVVRTLVDEAVLLPSWGKWLLDADGLTRMHLPRETASLLRRRIDSLEPATRSLLTVGAALGVSFEEELLVAASTASTQEVAATLSDAQRAQLIEPAGDAGFRFIHHTLRDVLLAAADPGLLPVTHQRIAEVFDEREARKAGSGALRFEIEQPRASSSGLPVGDPVSADSDADPAYRLAFHYAAGVPGKTSARAATANIAAGRAALKRFDNERAIVFFEAAGSALATAGTPLSPAVRLQLAEARLRTGSLNEALVDFRRVLAETTEPFTVAAAYGRIAVLHVLELDTEHAWVALDAAFERLGEKPPRETPLDLLASAVAWGRRRIRAPRVTDPASRSRDEILCALYYQAGRIAFSGDKPARLIPATLRALEPAERLGSSAALAKSYLAYAFLLTVSGFKRAGASYVARAERMGRELNDPVVSSHALQLHHVIAAWAGRIQEAIDAGNRCVNEFGHWRELGELSQVSYSIYEFQSIRGRDEEAWRALGRAIDRINQHDGAPVVPDFLLLSARAALTALGRERDARSLLHRLERATVAFPPNSASYSVTFAVRIKQHTEKMDIGPAFEALVAEFGKFGQNPKRAHIMLASYYVQVAHARVHVCLRTKPEARAEPLANLSRAFADLKAAARIPLVQAHAFAVEGYDHWFRGRHDEAEIAFANAERLAISETAPWVLYAVHRGRAHMLRTLGRLEAAHDQATLAESVAREHGSLYRSLWVREEFDLRLPRMTADSSDPNLSMSLESSVLVDETSPGHGASGARRQLRALLRISQARAQELDPDQQARLVVDELLQALRAQRGFLFLTREMARPPSEGPPSESDDVRGIQFIAGRDAAGRDIGDAGDQAYAAVREAMLAGAARGSEGLASRAYTATTARHSAIAVPLVVDDVTGGVVYLDRALGEGIFTDADADVLTVLAGQVSVALELTRSLRAREKAQENLRAAEKMDAVGRFATGIVHDLNNMLSAMRMASVAMAQTPEAMELVGEDIRTIESALQRANELTRQLGAFSRGEFGKRQLLDVNARLERLIPVIRGIVGDDTELETELSPRLGDIVVDSDQFDQVVMNLIVNARDALNNTGRITIETELVELDDAYAREHPRVRLGRHVRLSLSDTGHGMDDDIQHKIFEPYFTTKGETGGTGLGLSSVYWIVSRAGGHIDVRSKVGEGTTFALYFPCAKPSDEVSFKSVAKAGSKKPSRETVLLVEADASTARRFEQTLVERGYRVLATRSAAQALDLVRQRVQDVDLAIMNVALEGTSGLELARELKKLKPNLGVLYVSEDRGGVVAERGIVGGEVEFLSKHIAAEALTHRVREVIERTRTAS